MHEWELSYRLGKHIRKVKPCGHMRRPEFHGVASCCLGPLQGGCQFPMPSGGRQGGRGERVYRYVEFVHDNENTSVFSSVSLLLGMAGVMGVLVPADQCVLLLQTLFQLRG